MGDETPDDFDLDIRPLLGTRGTALRSPFLELPGAGGDEEELGVLTLFGETCNDQCLSGHNTCEASCVVAACDPGGSGWSCDPTCMLNTCDTCATCPDGDCGG